MVNCRVICLHFHTLNFAAFTLMMIVFFIVKILRLSYWVIQKNKAEDPRALSACRQYYRVRISFFFLSAPGYGYAVSAGISRPALRPDHILAGRLPLRLSHCHRQTYIIYRFFCNSCFSQYDTRCVCEKLIDKILSVSRETRYFSVFFARLR